MNFKNMDKMIKYTNERVPSVNLFYSTPSCYVKALNDIGKTWPTKTDDFFPYSNDPHAYWTGYFSSRPDYKGTVRKTNTYLQVINRRVIAFGHFLLIAQSLLFIDHRVANNYTLYQAPLKIKRKLIASDEAWEKRSITVSIFLK